MVSQSYSQENFRKHIKKDHSISTFSTYLREIVYGGVDGIITTFAVVAGFTGAQSGGSIAGFSVAAVLLFGFANLFADSVSMGLGNVLSVRADQDVYKKYKNQELSEIKRNPIKEIEETIFILKSKGFSDENAKRLATIYSTNQTYWLNFMMSNELEMESPEKENSIITGIMTTLSFISFGFIPLLPYIVLGYNEHIFAVSLSATLCALAILGVLRQRITQENAIRSVGEVVILGGVSAVVAYFVGTFFRG